MEGPGDLQPDRPDRTPGDGLGTLDRGDAAADHDLLGGVLVRDDAGRRPRAPRRRARPPARHPRRPGRSSRRAVRARHLHRPAPDHDDVERRRQVAARRPRPARRTPRASVRPRRRTAGPLRAPPARGRPRRRTASSAGCTTSVVARAASSRHAATTSRPWPSRPPRAPPSMPRERSTDRPCRRTVNLDLGTPRRRHLRTPCPYQVAAYRAGRRLWRGRGFNHRRGLPPARAPVEQREPMADMVHAIRFLRVDRRRGRRRGTRVPGSDMAVDLGTANTLVYVRAAASS